MVPKMKSFQDEYKITEIGYIPSRWKITNIGQLASIRRGASPRPIRDPKWFSDNSKIGWVRISDVTKSKKYLNGTEQYLSSLGVEKSRYVKPGDLIMSICGTIGRPIILNMEACIHDGFVVFNDIDTNQLDVDFMLYLLISLEDYFKGQGQPGTQVNLNTSIVEKTQIALPTLREQQKIAEILSTVDEQIENTEQFIEKTKELKKGLTQQLLTKGIGHTKFKHTELGEIPVEWEIKEFKEVMVLQRGFDLPIQDRSFGDIPIVSANGVSGTHNEVKVKAPGIVTGRSGTIGKVHFIAKDFWPLNTALYVKEIFDNEPKFLYYFLSNFGLEKYSTGTGVPTLNRNDVHKIKVAIPKTYDEQQKIAEILSTVDEQIDSYEQEKEKYMELKKGLMQQLLTGKIRVTV